MKTAGICVNIAICLILVPTFVACTFYYGRRRGFLKVPTVHYTTTYIYLDINLINETKFSDFQGLNQLKLINLSSNHLQIFPNFTFVGSTLESIALDYNQIKAVNKELLSVLKVIKNISIQNNQINKIPDFSGVGYSLFFLYIGHNNISNVSQVSFTRFRVLIQLQISFNKVQIFPNLTGSAKSLTKLVLMANAIQIIPKIIMRNLTFLRVLYLQNNPIKVIESLSGLLIQTLLLSKCLFPHFPSLLGLKHLEQITPRQNGILKINPLELDLRNRSGTLPLYISIAENKLNGIPPIIGPYLEGLNIDLSDNPLSCDDNLAWLISIKGVKLSGVCRAPTQLINKHIQDLTFKDLMIAKENQQKKETVATGILENTYSLTTPLELAKTSSLIECITQCVSTFGCLYVNYNNSPDTQSTNCHYCSPEHGQVYKNEPSNIGGWSYYSLQEFK